MTSSPPCLRLGALNSPLPNTSVRQKFDPDSITSSEVGADENSERTATRDKGSDLLVPRLRIAGSNDLPICPESGHKLPLLEVSSFFDTTLCF